MFHKYLSVLLLSILSILSLHAEKPEWIGKLPFSDDAFWGVGTGATLEDAQNLAKKEILMQLSSHVEAAITMEERSNGGDYEVVEELNAFFDTNSLRGAELEEQYEESNQFWALMKYCDECGDMLINSALARYEEKYDLDPEVLMEHIQTSNISEILKVERRMKELNLDDYKSEDINITLSGKTMTIMIINFIPYETNLSQSQQDGLTILSTTLFKELKELQYNSLSIVGHANPTGEENEEEDLIFLSKNRAQTMAQFLEESGFTVDTVSWKGGDGAITDVSTPEGMGENRRVEIVIMFE